MHPKTVALVVALIFLGVMGRTVWRSWQEDRRALAQWETRQAALAKRVCARFDAAGPMPGLYCWDAYHAWSTCMNALPDPSHGVVCEHPYFRFLSHGIPPLMPAPSPSILRYLAGQSKVP